MNNEIFEYVKELSRKEFFVVNVINTVLSLVIILVAILGLRFESKGLLYSIMFSATGVLLATNSYKCFKRGSKNGGVLAFMALVFIVFAVLCAAKVITSM